MGTFILFTTVPLHANAGKFTIGGTTTDAVGGVVLMAPTLYVWEAVHPSESVTFIR